MAYSQMYSLLLCIYMHLVLHTSFLNSVPSIIQDMSISVIVKPQNVRSECCISFCSSCPKQKKHYCNFMTEYNVQNAYHLNLLIQCCPLC